MADTSERTVECPYCGAEFAASQVTALPVHKIYNCRERPDKNQQSLSDF